MDDARSRAQRKHDLVLVVLFALCLLVPSVDFALHPRRPSSVLAELRTPARFPALPRGAGDWSRWPAAFEGWYDDHFGLRDELLRAHNALRLFALRTDPSPQVVRGRDGWLFIAVEQALEIWRGADPLTSEELEAWRRSLESRRRVLAERGVEYVFALAPNKAEIYPELLPARLRKGGPSRLEQLVEHLAATSDFRVLDLRGALLEEKRNDADGDFTYFPLGTHWTRRGALAGLRALVAFTGARLPALLGVDDAVGAWVPASDEGDSWAERLHLEGLLHQRVSTFRFADQRAHALRIRARPQLKQVVVDQDAPELPRALVFHDSFGAPLAPMLGRHFSHALFVWKPELDLELVEAERPDVVLQLFNDRVLIVLTPQELEQDLRARLEPAWRASTRVALRIDTARNEPPIEPRGDAAVAVRLEGEKAEIVCSMRSPAATLRLPAFEVPAGARAIVRLELESPAAGAASLFFQTRARPSFMRARQYRGAVVPGSNELYFEIADPDFNGRLLLRPSDEAGTFAVSALEVRLVEP